MRFRTTRSATWTATRWPTRRRKPTATGCRRGLTFTAATRTFSGTPQAADVATVSVKVTASDGNGGSVSNTFDIAINNRPTASNGEVTTTEDADYTFTAANFNFSDTDAGDVLSSVKITSLPAAGTLQVDRRAMTSATPPRTVTRVAIDASRLTYSPPPDANGDDYATFGFTVNDGTADSAAAQMTIDVTAVNDAPTVATAILDQAATAGTAFDYAFPHDTFSDADGDTPTYMATRADGDSLPPWLTFAAATRSFSGTPQAADVGTVSAKVTASDGNGGSVSDSFDIAVRAAGDTNSPPTASNGEVTATEDTDYTFTAANFNFSDTDVGDVLSSVKITSLPAAGTLQVDGRAMTSTALPEAVARADIDAGKLTYSPPADANGDDYATFGFTVNDGTDDSAAAQMTIDVTAVNDAPTVAIAIPDQAATAGTAFGYAFPRDTFSDADGDTLAYEAARADGAALPGWLAFAAATRSFSGTPQAADVGGRVDSTSADDYFQLTVAGDSWVKLRAIAIQGALLALTPTIRNSSDQEVDTYVLPQSYWSEINKDHVAFEATAFLTPGTYVVHVAEAAARSGGRYTLKVGFSAGNQDLQDRCTKLPSLLGEPLSGCQWHLKNTGNLQAGGARQDINVEAAWEITKGAGVTVAVIDGGFQLDHPDLRDNILPDQNHTPARTFFRQRQSHGTSVAGLIAARDNGFGMVGVAPRSSIYGSNVVEAFSSDVARNQALAAEAALLHLAQTAVSNNSWGFGGDGAPKLTGAAWPSAIERGLSEGFGGKGTVYVFGAGNGGDNDYSNLSEINSHYGVVTVCAVNYRDVRSPRSVRGPNLWVCAPSNERYSDLPQIATTTNGGYTDAFGGTSASAPLVSGVVALMRAANLELTWRDARLIIAATARKNHTSHSGWEVGALRYGSTSARYNYNHTYGFGVIDAGAAVALAQTWPGLPALRTLTITSAPMSQSLDNNTFTTTLAIAGDHIEFIEYVTVNLDIDHDKFRELTIDLIAPSGASSRLLAGTAGDIWQLLLPQELRSPIDLGSARHLGEDPEGTWTLTVKDPSLPDDGNAGGLEPDDPRPWPEAPPSRDRLRRAGRHLPHHRLGGARGHRRLRDHELRPALHPHRRNGQGGRALDAEDADLERRRPRLRAVRPDPGCRLRRAGPRGQQRRRGTMVRGRTGANHDRPSPALPPSTASLPEMGSSRSRGALRPATAAPRSPGTTYATLRRMRPTGPTRTGMSRLPGTPATAPWSTPSPRSTTSSTTTSRCGPPTARARARGRARPCCGATSAPGSPRRRPACAQSTRTRRRAGQSARPSRQLTKRATP